MLTVLRASSAEIEVKGSRFITTLVPHRLYAQTMGELQAIHTKARHFVYAYRYFNEHEQIVENQSDDGEPKGSSGKPTLAVLAGKGLVNMAAISVRYFGGTKLGVGGLVRAYGEAVNQAISDADLVEFKFTCRLKFNVDYSYFDKFLHLISRFEVEAFEKQFAATAVVCKIEIGRDLRPSIIDLFSENRAVEILD